MHGQNTERSLTLKRMVAILLPSWLSAVVAVAAGLLITAVVILSFSSSGIGLKQDLLNFGHINNSQPVLTLPGQAPPSAGQNSLETTWPLIAFWAIVGLIIYFIADLLFSVIRDAFAFKNELEYVNAEKDNMLRFTAELLIFRVVILLFWLLFLDLFFKRLIPYSILASKSSASDLVSMKGASAALLSCAVIAASLHINTIFLRLTLRRTRVLSSSDYMDVKQI